MAKEVVCGQPRLCGYRSRFEGPILAVGRGSEAPRLSPTNFPASPRASALLRWWRPARRDAVIQSLDGTEFKGRNPQGQRSQTP